MKGMRKLSITAPAMVAAAALTGKVSDARDVFSLN